MSEQDRERWNARYREEEALAPPSSFLVSLDALLPRQGRALDVAGGSGRNALWLARRGLDVTLADISPVALGRAAREAAAIGVPLEVVAVDLEREPLPAGPWDLIVCIAYLHRPLYDAFPDALAPGGWLAVEQATGSNLLRHERPGRAYLLDDGELPSLVRGLHVIHHVEGWLDRGRHDARLVARKPPA